MTSVDFVWETLRLWRLKAKFVEKLAHEGLDKVLRPLLDYFVRDQWVRELAAERMAPDRLDEFLKDAAHVSGNSAQF